MFHFAYLFSHSAIYLKECPKTGFILLLDADTYLKGEFFMSKLKKVILSAMLLALLIVLSRFLSVNLFFIKISFGFVATMLCAIWLGPVYSTIVAGLGDLIGAYLYPFGAYFPGYTLSAILAGFIYGLFLYKKTSNKYTDRQFIVRLIVCTTIINLLINGGLNTLWLYMTLSDTSKIIIPIRIAKQLIFIPIQVIMIFLLEKKLRKTTDEYLRD
jgi:ECF transporter S component (folate family)